MKIKAKQMPIGSCVTNGKIYDVVDKYSEGYLICNDGGLKVKTHRNDCEVITVIHTLN